VLFVGADFKRKGGPLLLDCMSDLTDTDKCELHLVTSVSVEPRHNVYVHNGLTANSPQLLDLFAQADIFVLPSYAECLAVVLMEATAAGLPIVTTDVGALSEAVDLGASGVVIGAGDGAALRQAVEALVNDPERRARVGRAGHALAQRKFNAQRNNMALLDVVVQHARNAQSTRRAA